MRIFNIVGPSGSGKTSLASSLDGNIIQSYTTRPKRHEYEWGHIFVDSLHQFADYLYVDDKAILLNDIVAYQNLNGHHYFATRNQFIDGDNIYIVNPGGANQVKDYFNCEVFTIYLSVDEEVRRKRLSERSDDIITRKQFDTEEFEVVQCDFTIDANREFNVVLEDLKRCIYYGRRLGN